MPSLVINGAIAVLSPVAWLALLMGASDADRLVTHGWRSLKYFTVLSNLLSALASALYLACRLSFGLAPAWLLVLKLAATSAVSLTFLTVAVLLGPRFGWDKMYAGANLWMHLLLPLLAIVDCVLFVPLGTLPPVATLAAIVPCALYGTWYLKRVIDYGAKDAGRAIDFYDFLRWGEERIAALFAGMLAVSWAAGLMLWFGSRASCPA